VPATAKAGGFAFRQGDLLLADAGDGELLPILTRDPDDHGLTVVRSQYLGTLAGRPCWSAEIDADAETPTGLRFHGLRTLFGRLPETLYAVAGRAAQIVAWDRDHRFCGRCATPTEPVPGERARRCPECGLTAYPRVSPAVIVLIEKGDRILLARGHQFPSGGSASSPASSRRGSRWRRRSPGRSPKRSVLSCATSATGAASRGLFPTT
jgi:NAD+ diphosphatase